MKAASHFDRLYLVIECPNDVAQLGDALRICALRATCEYTTTDAQHVASIQSRGFNEKLERPITRERIRQTPSFGPPARRSHDGDDRDFVHNHRRIFHENG